MKKYFFSALLCICLFLSGCGSTAYEEESSYLKTKAESDNINAFTCSICGYTSAVCDCHKELGYPEDVCCTCSRLYYKICSICGEAYPLEDIHNENGFLFCENCAESHGKDNPFYIDGESFYFEVATPNISDEE